MEEIDLGGISEIRRRRREERKERRRGWRNWKIKIGADNGADPRPI